MDTLMYSVLGSCSCLTGGPEARCLSPQCTSCAAMQPCVLGMRGSFALQTPVPASKSSMLPGKRMAEDALAAAVPS